MGGMSPSDAQFDAVIRAFAHHNSRPAKTPEQVEAERREAHRNDPKHKRALAKRRKAKRGGPR